MYLQKLLCALVPVGLVAIQATAQITFDSGTQVPTPQRPAGVVIANLNADSMRDLAVATDTPDKITISMGRGDGTFDPSFDVLLGAGVGAGFMLGADFDGDGDTDLAVALQNASAVRVLVNNGGSFVLGPTGPTGLNPRWLAAADFNGDGLIDIAAANRDSSDLSVLMNQGGSFVTTTIAAGDRPRSVAAGDFDADGDVDLAVANSRDRNALIWSNNGQGVFAAAGSVSFGPDLRPEGMVASDLNADGLWDLAAAASGNGLNVVSVFTSVSGSFGARVDYPVAGVDPGGVGAGDLDSDGDVDLVTVNQGSSDVTTLANNGDGTFGAGVSVPVGLAPDQAAMGDLTGDGLPDLAVSNRDSGTTSILVNTTPVSCLADFNSDGELNILDFLAFLNAYNAGDPSADLNADGTINTQDFIVYLNAYNEGCV